MENRSSVMPKTGRRGVVLAVVLFVLALIVFFVVAAIGDVALRGGSTNPGAQPAVTQAAPTTGPAATQAAPNTGP